MEARSQSSLAKRLTYPAAKNASEMILDAQKLGDKQWKNPGNKWQTDMGVTLEPKHGSKYGVGMYH